MSLTEPFKKALLEVNTDEVEQIIKKWNVTDPTHLRRYWREARGIEGSLEEMEKPLQ